MIDLGTLGGPSSSGTAINDRGEVSGYAETSPGIFHAFRWSRRRMIDLGTLGGTSSFGLALNDRGEVTGYSETQIGSFVFHAFLWSSGQLIDLGTLDWNTELRPSDQQTAVQ